MDRKVIMVRELHTLEGIANIAAFLATEVNTYIELGLVVETYTEDPSADNYKIMYDVFKRCSDRYPAFQNARQGQIALLVEHGSLVPTTLNTDTLKMYEHPTPPEINQEIPSNIIQFKPRPVDKE